MKTERETGLSHQNGGTKKKRKSHPAESTHTLSYSYAYISLPPFFSILLTTYTHTQAYKLNFAKTCH